MELPADRRFQHWLPPWPVVPPRLWATAAVGAVAALSVVFQRELWPNTPRAVPISQGLLVLALLAAGAQGVAVLWRWPAAYRGPAVLAALFGLLARAAALGLCMAVCAGGGVAIIGALIWAAGSGGR